MELACAVGLMSDVLGIVHVPASHPHAEAPPASRARERPAEDRAVRRGARGSSGPAQARVQHDERDVAATRRTLAWKHLAHPRRGAGPCERWFQRHILAPR
jgi:hypothetical protein